MIDNLHVDITFIVFSHDLPEYDTYVNTYVTEPL